MADSLNQTNQAKQAQKSVMTAAGAQNALELNLGMTPNYDTATTLNKLYNVFPTVTPTVHPVERYFGIGISGDMPTGKDNLMDPVEVSSTNLNLYGQIPFRLVPVEQDLTEAERDPYRIRVIRTIKGQQYVAYYLKKFVLLDNQVKFTKYDPATQSDQPYVLDPSQLQPKPPASTTDGEVTNLTQEITVSVDATMTILGSEIYEVINILYGGDPRYAFISEIGLYTGTDVSQQATDNTGKTFTYTEAIFARLSQQRTFMRQSFLNASGLWSPTVKFTSANMCVDQTDSGS